MTSSFPPPQDLAAATFQGWGEVTTAWFTAAQRWWGTIVEWAYDECAYSGPNQTTAYVTVPADRPLRGEFHRAGDVTKKVPPHLVSIGWTTDAALATGGAPATSATAAASGLSLLVITVKPSPATPPGGYRGRVIDTTNGAAVADSLFVLVATTS